MNSKQIKIVLIMFSLVLFGFVAGFITHRQLTQHHIEEVVRFGNGQGFKERLPRLMDMEAEQKEEVGAILRKYGDQMRDLSKESRKQRRVIMDSLKLEIFPLLNADQQRQFERKMKRFNKWSNKKKRKEREKSRD